MSYFYINGQRCDEVLHGRRTQVKFKCCNDNIKRKSRKKTYIKSVKEKATCSYLIQVCSSDMCLLPALRDSVRFEILQSNKTNHVSSLNKTLMDKFGRSDRTSLIKQLQASKKLPQSPKVEKNLSSAEIVDLRDRVKKMFYNAYDAYMEHAFPMDELKPLSCSGENFDLTAGNMLTLIDSLDMLVVLNNHSEFERAVGLVSELARFDQNKTISVFETTIRILGGLLSAHGLAMDYPHFNYNGTLLDLAVDLADRMMPAFNTSTSIPYGTINLKTGVPKGETEEACTAAAGSLSLEFGMLSVYTGNKKYGLAARDALKAIYDLRSKIGLVGRHINTRTGKWTEPQVRDSKFYCIESVLIS